MRNLGVDQALRTESCASTHTAALVSLLSTEDENLEKPCNGIRTHSRIRTLVL